MLNKNLFYDAELVERSLNPHNMRELCDEKLLTRRGYNPTCGDDLTVQLAVEGGAVRSGAFHGESCAISRASADLMLDMIAGKSAREAMDLCDAFCRFVEADPFDPTPKEMRPAVAFECVRQLPSRKKCACLPWKTMKEMLQDVLQPEQTVVEEPD